MTLPKRVPSAFRLLAVCCLTALPWLAGAAGVEILPQTDRVVVRVDGEPFTELRFSGAPKPYFYPLLGPGGVAVTRNFPMRTDAEDEEKDHPHHRSLWFTHGDVNGIDFWAEGAGKGRILQDKILEARGGSEKGVLRTANRWVTDAGELVLSDETTFRVHRHPAGRLFDYEITLHASAGKDVRFGDTKEGTFGIRLAESMRLKANKHYAGKPTGHILQDTGVKDGDTWGKRARWTAYSGPVGNEVMSVVVFDHSKNLRHPTWWHVRDYGLFAANPFGIHDFEKKAKGAGDLVLKSGEKLTLRYRVLIRKGEIDPVQLNGIEAGLPE